MRTSLDLVPLRVLLLTALGLGGVMLAGCGDKEDEDDGSGTTDSGGDAGSSDGGSDGGTAVACTGATEILDDAGAPTGYVVCPDGAVNRLSSRDWDPTIDGERCWGTEVERHCDVDADCTASPYGACLHTEIKGGFGDACTCTYSCAKDADCDDDELCVGAGVVDGVTRWPSCVPASCSVSDDCPSSECGIEAWHDGCSWNVDIACRSDADECRSDADCDDSCGQAYDGTTFECQEAECALGRPLLVDGVVRTAPVGSGRDARAWVDALQPVVPVSRKARRALAAHWARVGALEHASVASFGRFGLELMALGAPPELLVEAQQAQHDEIVHARLAFGLASAYAGQGLGPGPLALDGVTIEQDPAAILASLVEEACINETLAAAEAAACADACTDPAVTAVLRRIADDEARHAALGWRCLQWLLDSRPELTGTARTLFASLSAELRGRALAPASDLSELGLLGPAALADVRRRTLDEVVLPCLAALLDTERAAA